MITNQDITEAIAALVEQAFPGEPVYRDFAPTDFQRPSTLVELTGGTYDPNIACSIVEIRPVFTLTAFVKVDAYHHQDTAPLTIRQMKLLGLFLPGYIKVKDRAPHVLDGGKLLSGLDYAGITVPLSYTLDRREFMELAQAEDMLKLQLRTEVTTNA